MEHVVPVQGRRYTIRYSASVVFSLQPESTCMWHSVQLATGLQQWQGKSTGDCLSVGGIATTLKNVSVMPSGRFQGNGGEVLRRRGKC
jgi:hypothetical protein